MTGKIRLEIEIMVKITSQKFIFDFDGVICDSAFEAFRIGATVAKLIHDPNDPSVDSLYTRFLKYRSKVGPAWNYYYVFQDIEKLSEVSSAHWTYNEKVSSFENEFFDTRRKFQEDDFSSWLSLHKSYDIVTAAIKKLNIKPVILTNKNYDPVSQLMTNYALEYDAILSTTDFSKDMRKIDIINEHLPNAKFFIDDHLETIEACQAHKLSDELIIKYAVWGYGNKLHHKLGIDERNLEICLNMILQQ